MSRGPRQELLEDRVLGPAGVELLYRAVRSVAVARRFPPPDGCDRWDIDAVQSVAHEFLDSERATRRLAAILISSTDEVSFEALLHTAVLNMHRDRGRRTDRGALVLRVNEILSDSQEFRRDNQDATRWTLTAGHDGPSTVPTRELEAAALGVTDIKVPRWTSAARRAPSADRPSFIRLLTAVLQRAGGSLSAVDLARACEPRLDGRAIPITVDLDVLEYLGADSSTRPTEDGVLSAMTARSIFDGLSERERLLLATHDVSVREAARTVGIGHSQAALLRRRLFEHLRSELTGDPDAEDISSNLLEIADQWMTTRTGGHGATF